MRLTLGLMMAAMALSFPVIAEASDIAVTGRAAGWTAFAGLSSNGTPVCGIYESGSDGRSFHIKSFVGQPDLTVQVFKPGWSIPSGTRIPASIQFGAFSPWGAVAVGTGNMVEFRVPPDKVGQFASQFRAADQFRLTFLSGNEGSWTGPLEGSGAAMEMLGKCIAGRQGGSQPFDPPPPAARSPPFSPAPSPPAGSPRLQQPRQVMI